MNLDALNEAQIELARIIAGHEAALYIDRHESGMAGFAPCFEANLSLETQAMLAEYEAIKGEIFTECLRMLKKLKETA